MGTKTWVERIHAVRERYGVSQRSLGILLGISEPSIVRYEKGSTPSASNARLLELAESPSFMRRCFDEAGDLLPAPQRASMEAALARGAAGDDALDAGVTPATGFAARDPGRVSAAMNYLSALCQKPYYTRIIKACFVADFLSYEKNGVSLLGLSYARAPHGPVVDGHQRVRRSLEQSGDIVLEDDGMGLLFASRGPERAMAVFSPAELDILDLAARFVDSYSTVGQLSEATRALPCWQRTQNGALIPYERDCEVSALVESRLYEPNDELERRLGPGADEGERTSIDELFSEVEEDA